MDPTKFTAVVADDQLLISEGLAALCEGIPGCTVLGHASDGEEVWEMIQRMNPDVAFVDLHLAKSMTLEVLHRSRENGGVTKIIILSSRGDRKAVMEMLRAGAAGVLLKSGTGRDLEEACSLALAGGVYVSPTVALQAGDGDADQGGERLDHLSSREHQVFSMLVEGVRAKEIAERLSLSPKTVDTYRASLMRKLDIHNVPGLVKYAIQHKVTPLEFKPAGDRRSA